jgi:hypothetical protein
MRRRRRRPPALERNQAIMFHDDVIDWSVHFLSTLQGETIVWLLSGSWAVYDSTNSTFTSCEEYEPEYELGDAFRKAKFLLDNLPPLPDEEKQRRTVAFHKTLRELGFDPADYPINWKDGS